MYWEEYAGQPTEGFDFIGVDDFMVPIEDAPTQAEELYRICGSDTILRIYKKEESGCLAMS